MNGNKVNLQTEEGIRTALSKTAELVLNGKLKANEATAISRMCETALKSIEGESWGGNVKL